MNSIKLGDNVKVKEEFQQRFTYPELKGYEFFVYQFEVKNVNEIEIMLAQKQDENTFVVSIYGTIEELNEMLEVVK